MWISNLFDMAEWCAVFKFCTYKESIMSCLNCGPNTVNAILLLHWICSALLNTLSVFAIQSLFFVVSVAGVHPWPMIKFLHRKAPSEFLAPLVLYRMHYFTISCLLDQSLDPTVLHDRSTHTIHWCCVGTSNINTYLCGMVQFMGS